LRVSSACSAATSLAVAIVCAIVGHEPSAFRGWPAAAHDVVAAPAEVVVQRAVLGVQLVVDRRRSVRQVGAAVTGPSRAAAVATSGRPRRRPPRGSPSRAPGPGRSRSRQRQVEHVRVDLHQQRVLQQAAGDDELVTGTPAALNVSTISRVPNAVASSSAR
jgi:hypothetical protein